nr:DNA cytosine methyltransferase [Helicobacter sp. 11S02596-1]
MYKFANIIKHSSPDIVSMENVPQLKKHKVFEDFVTMLRDNDYHVSFSNVFCPDYGIPQKRTRLVLLASKLGWIELIKPTHNKTNYMNVYSTIGHLPEIPDGVALIHDPLHFSRKLSEANKKRIKQSKQGGTWQSWSDDLLLDCHKKETGKSYTSVYGRMSWDEPAPTMTTQCIGLGNGRFGHPEQDRAITLREATLFQTFPENYQFIENFKKPIKIGEIARQIGNAVPVKLGSVVGKSIKNHLREVFK